MENLTYRTDDLARWGTGQGSNLAANQVDRNFFALFSAVSALEDHQQFVATIVDMNAVGDQFFVTLSDDTVIGPITIPTSNWHFRADGWLPNTLYDAYDVFNHNGMVVLVNIPHTSGPTFSIFATDGESNDLYSLLLEEPTNFLPPDGTPGQILVRLAGSPISTEWQDQKVRISTTVAGQPLSSELLFHYPVVDNLTLLAGLPGSVGYAELVSDAGVSYPIKVNGVDVGSIDFSTAAASATATFLVDVDLIPGDIVSLYGPASPDASQANIGFTIVANVTG
jgi:hypothetical protein